MARRRESRIRSCRSARGSPSRTGQANCMCTGRPRLRRKCIHHQGHKEHQERLRTNGAGSFLGVLRALCGEFFSSASPRAKTGDTVRIFKCNFLPHRVLIEAGRSRAAGPCSSCSTLVGGPSGSVHSGHGGFLAVVVSGAMSSGLMSNGLPQMQQSGHPH